MITTTLKNKSRHPKTKIYYLKKLSGSLDFADGTLIYYIFMLEVPGKAPRFLFQEDGITQFSKFCYDH